MAARATGRFFAARRRSSRSCSLDFRLQVRIIEIDAHFFRVSADHFNRVAERVLQFFQNFLFVK